MSKHLYKDWYVLNEAYYTTTIQDGLTCYNIFTNIGGTLAPNYFYSSLIYPNNIGNTISVKAKVIYGNTDLTIKDGTYTATASIGNDSITIGSTTISYDTSVFTTYRLNLKGSTYELYVNEELFASGSATQSSTTPVILFGYTTASAVNSAYVAYLQSGRAVQQSFVVSDWSLLDINGYSKTAFEGILCSELTPALVSGSASANFFYKDSLYSSAIGNTISTKLALGEGDYIPLLSSSSEILYADQNNPFIIGRSPDSNPAQLCISDGAYIVNVDIAIDNVSVGANTYSLDTTVFHDYVLNLKNGKYQLFIDNDLVLQGNATASNSRRALVGFAGIPTIYDRVYIKYLKSVQGAKYPINLNNVSFDLQVDTKDSFETPTPNLKTYFSVDNLVFATQDGAHKVTIKVNSNNGDTDGSAIITLDGVSGNSVSFLAGATASSIALALAQGGIPSGWTATCSDNIITIVKNDLLHMNNVTEAYNNVSITGGKDLDISLDIFHRGTALGNGIVRSFTIPLLPRQEDKLVCYFFRVRINNAFYTSNWAGYTFDEPQTDVVFTTKDIMKEMQYLIDGLVAFCYENRHSYMLLTHPTPADLLTDHIKINDSVAIWRPVSNSYFILDSNNTMYYFNRVYNNRLPDGEVYTKYDLSGNIANALVSEAHIIDNTNFEIKNINRDLTIQSCRDSNLYNNFGSLYGLASEYFNTINEYRDTLLNIIKGYCEPGNTATLKDILAGITGAVPVIDEFKNKKKWIIWDTATSLSKRDDEKYILFNPEHPYSKKNKALLYSSQGKAFTYNIHLYNPFGLSINPTMIRIIVDSFKPVFSQANIIFYDKEGLPHTYPAEYYFSNYGQGLFYAEDTEAN